MAAVNSVCPPGEPAAFMDGVALFDQMLATAERCADQDRVATCNRYWIRAEYRKGVSLELALRPLIAHLIDRPASADGFSAALMDYLFCLHAGLVPANGAQHEGLTYEEVTEWEEPPEEPEPIDERSNVIAFPLARRSAAHG